MWSWYQANIDWLKQYWGEAADNFLIRGTIYAQGQMLKNLLDQNMAPMGNPTQCHIVAVDARAPKFDGGIVMRAARRAWKCLFPSSI
jgi:tricarballylate dehydrogenase